MARRDRRRPVVVAAAALHVLGLVLVARALQIMHLQSWSLCLGLLARAPPHALRGQQRRRREASDALLQGLFLQTKMNDTGNRFVEM